MSQNRTEIVISALNQTQAAFQQINRSMSDVAQHAKTIDSQFSTLGKSIKSALAFSVASISVGSLLSDFNKIIETLSDVNKAAEKAGMSVQELYTLRKIGKLENVDMGQLVSATAKLSKNILEAQSGNKDLIALFKALNIELSNNDGPRRTFDILRDIGKVFPTIEDGWGKSAIAMKLFGKSGAELIPFLNTLQGEISNTNVTVTKEMTEAAENFEKNMIRMSSSVQGLKISLLGDLLPALVTVSDYLSKIISTSTFKKLSSETVKNMLPALRLADLFGSGGEKRDLSGKRLPLPPRTTAVSNPVLEAYLKALKDAQNKKTSPKRVAGGPAKKTEDLPSAYEMMTKETESWARRMAKWWNDEQKQAQEAVDIITKAQEEMAERQENQHEAAMSSFEHKLTLVDTAAAFRDISRAEAAKQRIALTRQLITEQERWVEVTGKGVEKLDELRAKLREAQAQLLTASDNVTAGGITGMLEYLDELPSLFEGARDTVKGAFQEMEDALVEFVRTGKMNFSSLVDSIISDLARIMVRQNITGPLAAGLGSALSGWFGSGGSGVDVDTWGGLPGGLLGNAKGNAFSGGNVVPFAKGGVVYRPTFFPMAKGMGLMGEAGPEGVLPLARTRGGELGVRTTGASSLTISVPVNVQGNARLASELRNEIEKTVIDVVRRHS